MKIPEYKLKWLEKQLNLYGEPEREFFENFDFICSMMMNRYLQSNPAFAEEPLVIFLKQFANDTLRSHQGDACLAVDDIAYDIDACMFCAVWCLDLLQAYDKWRKKQENS